MRPIIDMTQGFNEVLEDAVPVKLVGERHAIYVDVNKVDEIKGLAIISGNATRKKKLNELWGFVKNNVAPYSDYEVGVDGKRQYDIKRVEVFAVDNLEEVANGEAPNVVASAGDPENKGRAPRTPTQVSSRRSRRQTSEVPSGASDFVSNEI